MLHLLFQATRNTMCVLAGLHTHRFSMYAPVSVTSSMHPHIHVLTHRGPARPEVGGGSDHSVLLRDCGHTGLSTGQVHRGLPPILGSAAVSVSGQCWDTQYPHHSGTQGERGGTVYRCMLVSLAALWPSILVTVPCTLIQHIACQWNGCQMTAANYRLQLYLCVQCTYT